MFLTFEIALWNVQLRLFGIISIIVDVSNNRLIWTGSPPFCERGSLVGYLDFNPVLIVARPAVLNSSPRAPPLCTFRMLLLSLQTFVLFERKCPAKWTSHDIPP